VQVLLTQQVVQHGQLSSKSPQSVWNAGNVILKVSHTAEGMVPEKAFEFSWIDVNLLSSESSDGTTPDNEL
jgi:hypothetical protein